MRNYPSDSKKFRKIREVALERHCEQTLVLVSQPKESSQTHHERYLELCELIKERDKQVVLAFDDVHRSTAVMQLQAMVSFGLLTAEEFAQFSEDIQSRITLPEKWYE